MRYVFAFTALLIGLMALPQSASAYDGYAGTTLTVRAGPGPYYPVIGRIGSHTPVNIRGCVNGMKWCDVSTRGFRGWVAGNYIRTGYQSRDYSLIDIGSRLGLPVITFSERDYWGTHYYNTDFYRTRYGWNDNGRSYGWYRTRDGEWRRSSSWRDTDRDGVPNRYDRDDDNDGIRDSRDRDDDNNGVRDSRDRWNYNHGYRDDYRSNYRYNNSRYND